MQSLVILQEETILRVLIVDDNASMRAMLSGLMASQQYEVTDTLEDGHGVMASILRKMPDIVCLDYQMPGRDGLEILHEINEKHPEVDVLFMTASEDADLEKKVADAGAAGFLRKPFGQKQVLEEIQQVFATRQQAQKVMPRAVGVKANTVVIADDNSSIRSLLKGLLSGLGLDVLRTVGNGQEAINAVRDLKPQLLCLDVEMPIMNGLDALPQIRQLSPQTTVIMVTGNASREFVQQAAAHGAKGYILKPVRPAYVEAFVRKLLA
jgi:CheY-like chemotaxis protein